MKNGMMKACKYPRLGLLSSCAASAKATARLAEARRAKAGRPSRRGRRVTGNRLPNRFNGLFGPPFDGFPPDFLSLLDRGDPDAVDAVEPLQHPLPVPDALRLDAHHDGGDAVVVVETLVH